MKRIFSIIMEEGLGLPTGTIAFWGTLIPRILTVDHTFKCLHTKSQVIRTDGSRDDAFTRTKKHALSCD